MSTTVFVLPSHTPKPGLHRAPVKQKKQVTVEQGCVDLTLPEVEDSNAGSAAVEEEELEADELGDVVHAMYEKELGSAEGSGMQDSLAGLSFTDLLLGAWDGFDMHSAMFGPSHDTPAAAPATQQSFYCLGQP